MNGYSDQKVLIAGLALLFFGLCFFGYEYHRATRIQAHFASGNNQPKSRYRIFYMAGHFGVSDSDKHGTYYSNAFPPAWLKFALILSGAVLVSLPLFQALPDMIKGK